MTKQRCRFCFGVLKTPQCERCSPTHIGAGRILMDAFRVRMERGSLFDETVAARIRDQEKAQNAEV